MPTTTGNTKAMRSCTAAFKEKNLLCNIVAGKAIITSAVAGSITCASHEMSRIYSLFLFWNRRREMVTDKKVVRRGRRAFPDSVRTGIKRTTVYQICHFC